MVHFSYSSALLSDFPWILSTFLASWHTSPTIDKVSGKFIKTADKTDTWLFWKLRQTENGALKPRRGWGGWRAPTAGRELIHKEELIKEEGAGICWDKLREDLQNDACTNSISITLSRNEVHLTLSLGAN